MTNTGEPAPARLYAILARDAPVGVVLRRGPSDWVQIILWHTDTDTFEYGQWFHGRIYEDVCDLSPDGSKFLYFAMKAQWKDYEDKNKMFKWTAISNSPFLTALALWPNFDFYHKGGGYFVDEHRAYLYSDAVEQPAQGHVPKTLKIITARNTRTAKRLPEQDALNGWVVEPGRDWQQGRFLEPQKRQKDKGMARYSLVKITYDLHDYEYSLIEKESMETTESPDVT